jgi:polyketide synthase PksN
MDTAIIGVAYRFPGASDRDTFWKNLEGRKSSVVEVPTDRWDWRPIWGDPKIEVNKTFSRWGGFIQDVDRFDHEFFGFLPKVVQNMDPQQRIMLELAWASLEDAGIPPSSLRGRRVGVFAGVTHHDYKELLARARVPIEPYHYTGTATVVVPNRVSHVFGLCGPSLPVDTACSSALNAIHLAIQSFEKGECEMALAGGISLILNPARHISVSKMGTLSPTGSCKTLDDRADGYVRGEGAGFFVLKPLEKALADNDLIYGVIKGSAVNHCGKSHTLSYPNSDAQADVIVDAHRRAGVPISSVNFVELHGTGTAKGDPIEFEGLRQAFARLSEEQGIALDNAYCGLSSAKTNIGHLEAAAGMAGVAKVLLAFQHRRLPGFHDFRTLNSRVTIDGTPFYILDETRPWLRCGDGTPLRAGVSSFGFGGTNAHLVLEEPPPPAVPTKRVRRTAPNSAPNLALIVLSAKTPGALRRRRDDLAAWLRADAGEHTLDDIARTLLLERDHLPLRFACVTDSLKALIGILSSDDEATSAPAESVDEAQAQAIDAEAAALTARWPKMKKSQLGEALATLAELFQRGAAIDGLALYPQPPVRRVRLPVYAFERHRFWLPEADAVADDSQRRRVDDQPHLHPLLHRNAPSLDLQRFLSVFDGSEFFLADHIVRGQRTLPGVAYLEMVRAAVVHMLDLASSPESYVVRIADVVWLRPLTVGDQRTVVEVELTPIDATDQTQHLDFEFRISIHKDGAAAQAFCRGMASLESGAIESTPTISALVAGVNEQWRTADEIYADFAEQGLQYGPAHRIMQDLHVAPNYGLARIELPGSIAGDADRYVLHPGVADAALQAAVAFFSAAGGEFYVRAEIPFAIDEVLIRRAPVGPVYAYVRRSRGSDDKFDIDILDSVDGGRCCVAFRGLSVRPLVPIVSNLPAAALKPAPDAAETMPVPASLKDALYATEWRAESTSPVEAPIPQIVLIGPQQELDWAESLLRSSHRLVDTRFERILLLGEGKDATGQDAPGGAIVGGQLAVRAGVIEDYHAALAALAARGVSLQRTLLLPSHTHHQSYSERIAESAQHIFALAKAMFRGTKSARLLYLVPPFEDDVEHLALSGLFKTLRIEKPSYSGRVLDGTASNGNHVNIAEIVVDEFLCTATVEDVRYRADVREVRGFVAVGARVERPLDPDAAEFREGGTYLITGGLGGLGRIVARHLCARYRARVYLTGRSTPGEKQQAMLAEIEALGGTVKYLICDVADREDVRRAIAAIHADGYRLNGVLHSAGVIEDAFVLRKSAEEFSRVIAPKTFGTWHLDEATRDEPLDMFVLFSSVAGALGNVGQCDYAYGNAFQDAFAHMRETLRLREQRSGKSLSVNWPFWLNGGMRLGETEIEAVRRSFGIVPLLDAPGLDALEFAMAQGRAQLLVMPGDAARVREVLGATTPTDVGASDVESPSDAFGDGAINIDAVSAYLADLFTRQLNISAEFESDKSFKDYGFDSVVMIELTALLEKTFGTLPKTLFFEYPNLGEIAAYFVEHHADVCSAIARSDEYAASVPVDAGAIAGYLSDLFAEQLRIMAELETDKQFKDYGFDSVVMIELIALLEKTFGTLPKTLFFEYPTLGELSGYFLEHHAEAFARELGADLVQDESPDVADIAPYAPHAPSLRASAFAVRRSAVASPVEDAIAIVGLAGRYPQAETLEAFWENLRLGRDCIETIPAERPDIAAKFRFRPGEPAQAHSYAHWGGFLRDVDRFDAAFFNISPKEAEILDPNERLFLEIAAHAIEDAGYTPDTLASARGTRENPVGVYVGLMWGDYQLHGVDRPQDAWVVPHSCYWAVANRVSYQFNFSGPSLTLDTACSSSLTAIHLACQAIRQGEIDVAIAGASNLSLHPNKYNLLSDMHFLSKDGRCRAFGEGGTGYVPGEGVGAVVLKSLSRARRDGDHIYGVIRGSAINHGGKASGFTVPNPKRQAALIQEALNTAGVDPRHIGYIEAHGTGTSLGDPIEISALTKAFGQSERQYCAIGSAKANIGHLEAAAGIAGLTKLLLQLQHRMLAPSIHSDTLNPFIDFANSPFRVQRSLEPWQRPTIERDGRRSELPRIAGLSSFGAGGANGHLVIEEYVDDVRADATADAPVVVVLSARKESALPEMALRLAERLRANPDIGLQDAAYTLQIGRIPMEFRIAFAVSQRDALLAALRAFGERGVLGEGAWSGHRDAARRDPAIAARVKSAPAQVNDWLTRRDLASLARAWVDGVEIDWSRLHAPGRRRRVSLPGYAFQRQRYWVPDAPVIGAGAVALHPLIDANVSTLDEQSFAKTFRGNEFYLRDHRLGDNRILPGVAYLEMAIQAARLAAPGRRVAALRDVRWQKPILVGDEPLPVRIALIPEREGVTFELYAADAASHAIYAQGEVVLDDTAHSGAIEGAAERLDLNAIRARCRVDERATIDAAFAAMGFAFGESFRAIERLHYNADEALGELRLAQVAGVDGAAFLLHPGLLDGALRASLGIGGIAAGAATIRVPVALGEIEMLGPLGEHAFVHVRRSHQSVSAGQAAYDLDLCDADGRVRLRIRRLVSQAAPQLALMAQRVAASAPMPAVAAKAVAPPPATVAMSVANVAMSAPSEIATALLQRLLSDATKLPPDQIDPNAPLENYGIDSIMIATLNRGLENRFGEVPKTLFFEYQEIAGIAEYLAEQHGDALRAMSAEFSTTQAAATASLPASGVSPAQVAASADTPLSAVLDFLKIIVAETTGLSPADIDPLAPMENYGIDSVMIVKLTGRIEQAFGAVSKTMFFEYQEIAALAEHLTETFPDTARRMATDRVGAASLNVAIIAPISHADVVAAIDVAPAIADGEKSIAYLFSRMLEAVGDDAAGCTVETPIAAWPIDTIAMTRLLHALALDFEEVDAFAPYRYATLAEWAATLRWKAERADAFVAPTSAVSQASLVPTGPSSSLERARGSRRFGLERAVEDDIAIVGLSGHYPGAEDLHGFWRNLAAGRDGIGEIPLSRWDHARIFDPDRSHKGTAYAKWGGFLDGIDRFDARFFNISAREAEIMDPQERLFLQTAWECVEDACYTRQSLKGRSIGVFVGVAWPYYSQFEVSDRQMLSGRPSTTFASIANRVSYFMNFSGPSMAVDTMCSSSLTAIHLAIRAIHDGDCDQAIAGGVNLITHRNKYLQLCSSQFLSSDGRCRAFGEGGDGYVPGEGVGAVMLKRLSQAVADGDHIYGVIKATALNHGGKTNGYTVPNQPAQTAVIGKALKRSGWDPRTIDYIEAHGTGTSLGDPIEIAGLTRAFAHAASDVAGPGARVEAQSCPIGSIKSNFGHLESAAAIAGLTKILMQFRYGAIAPSLHSATLNSNIEFTRTPFRVVQREEAWPAQAGRRPRRAGLSSFGAGGSNSHCLIEDYARPLPARIGARPALFVLSADSEQRLARYVDRVIAFLERGGDPDVGLDLADLAFSSQIGRETMSERLAVVATGIEELMSALRAYRERGSDERVVRGSPREKNEKLEAIVDETEKDALIQKLIDTGRLPQLARAWASMLDVDWARFADALYPSSAYPSRPRRMPFPTMPFLAERYWVEEKSQDATVEALHPLIDRNVSTLSMQAYRKRFDGHEFYLRDHVVRTESGTEIRERKILPGAAYLEMARAAGELAIEGDGMRVARIRNLMWTQPFEIAANPDSLSVRMLSDERALRFEIARDSDGGVCVEGELHVGDADEPCEDERFDIAAVRARGGLIEPGQDEIYAGFARMGFQFGPSFRITQARYRLAEGALCHLRLPEHLHAGLGDYGMHPAMLDAVLRSGLAVGVGEGGPPTVPIVPFALDALEYRHPLPAECFVYVTRSRDALSDSGPGVAVSGAEAAVYKYDLIVTDSDGLVLAKLNGFAGRPLTKPPQAPTRAMRYFGYEWKAAPLPARAAAETPAKTVLLATNSQALADAMASCLSTQDRLVSVLLAGANADDDTSTHKNDHTIGDRFDPSSADSAAALFASLRERGLTPDRIVYCDDAVDAHGVDTLPADALHRGIQAVRRLFVAAERSEPGAAKRFLYAFRDGAAAQPQHDAIAGYARSLLTVNHRFELATLRDDRDDAAARARAILDELESASGFGANEIAYRDGRRLRRTLHALDDAFAASGDALGALALREGGNYLITGGGGKLGLVIARYLAERTRGGLILSGRSQATSERVQREIEALRALGARVEYRSADTSDANAVSALVAAIERDFGALHGVIHCAGVAGDRPILDLDDRDFDEMLIPKTEGLIHLDRATATQPLDLFVCFSSVSALLGDLGSGAYAVGNRFMDTYARWREAQRAQGRRNGRSVSINWPLWATGGMEITGGDASVFGFSGMQALDEAEGLEAFDKILRRGDIRVLVSVGDPQRIARTLRLQDAAVEEPSRPTSMQSVPTIVHSAAPRAIVSAAAPAPSRGDDLSARAEAYVRERMAAVTKTKSTAIDANASFEQCGLDSVLLLELHAALKTDFEDLSKTALFEYDSAARLAQFLIAQHGSEVRRLLGAENESTAPAPISTSTPAASGYTVPEQALPGPLSPVISAQPLRASRLPSKRAAPARVDAAPTAEEGIAIVGIAGEFPSAPDLERFWSNLREGRDCIRRIPGDRGFSTHLNRRRSRSGKPIADAGGFIEEVDRFDPSLFRMSQTDADKADPQLRVLLRNAWRAVEDAAYTPEGLARLRVGVFIGAMNEDFTWIASELQARSEDYLGPGSVSSELSNRISFLMNLHGPSLTLSTACSASLTAVHLARRAILAGDCDAALVGGVNLSLHQSKYQLLHDMKVLSPDGQERTFDDGANGLVPSEGAGVVVLKRLSRAQADGDRIYGVIRASRISHSGTGAGQFMPNIRVMADTAAQAIADAGIAIEDLGYIESHGTGTELGDPIELAALANALRRSTDATGLCAIGSKANIGHMEAASGLGSLIKVLLSMRHGEIAPCAKLRHVNSSFDAARSPFYFPQTAVAWPANARGTRVAAINSFGMGGSNAFVVLESPTHGPAAATIATHSREPVVFALSARSADGLRGYASTVIEFLRARRDGLTSDAFSDFAYVTQIGRVAWRHRLAVVARDADEALAALDAWRNDPERQRADVFAGDIDSPLAHDTLRLFDGDAGAGFFASLIGARRLDKLAELWVRGAQVDWPALHRDHPRRRASFPSAPFESVHCDLRRLAGNVETRADAASIASESVSNDLYTVETAAIDKTATDTIERGWCRLESVGEATVGAEIDGDALREYWVERLRAATDTASEFAKALPLDSSTEATLGLDERPLHFVSELLDTELLRTIQGFSHRHGIAIETLVAAAWAVLMNRYTKARCSQFGFFGAAARGDAAQALLPVRVRTVGRQKMLQWLQELQADLLRHHRDALAPIERIREWAGHEPLFDSVVAFDSAQFATGADNGTAHAGLVPPTATHPASVRPLVELATMAGQDSLELTLIYRAESPDYDKAGMLLEQFIVLLEGIVSNPDKMPSALGMRTRAESRERFWKTMEATTE